jgi:hypothetical protein
VAGELRPRPRPLLALLAAHAQATRNRATRELGRSGVLVLGILVVLIGGTFLLPLWMGMLSLGWVLGSAVARPDATTDAVFGALLFGMSYLGGATSGTVSGAKHLTWEAYRTYPVRLRSVFFAELAASAFDLMPIVLGTATAALCIGLGIAQRRLVPLLPLVVVEGVVGALVVQLLVGAFAERVVRRLRVVLAMLALLLSLGILLGLMASAPQQAGGDALGTVLSVVTRLREPLEHAAVFLPTTWTARSLSAMARGDVALALALHAVPLGALSVLGLVTAHLVEREQAHATTDDGPRERLWSFRTAAAGIARLQLTTILDSRVGRFGLVFPLVVVVLVRGPLTMLVGRAPWAVPGAFIYVALLGSQFQLNQFGLDAHGTKTLLLLPIAEQDIWRGKARGLIAYQSMQGIGLAVLLAVLHRPSSIELSTGVLVFFAMVALENVVGRMTSVLVPRMMPRKRLQANATPMGLILVALGLSLGVGGTVGTAFALLSRDAPAWRPLVALVLLLLALGAQHVLLPAASRLLCRRKETLLAALG